MCEHDYVIAPSVNKILRIQSNCEKTILNSKNYSNFTISHNLCPKIALIESPLLKLYNNTKSMPNFSKIFIFDFIEFSLTKLFNVQ
jgi:hypothetical protein